MQWVNDLICISCPRETWVLVSFLLSLFYPLNPYSSPLRKPLSPEGIVRRANPSDIQISLVWNGSSESPFLMSTLTRIFISNKQVFFGPHFEKLVRGRGFGSWGGPRWSGREDTYYRRVSLLPEDGFMGDLIVVFSQGPTSYIIL